MRLRFKKRSIINGGEKVEDVKIKLSILWIIRQIVFAAEGLLALYEPGGIQDMISGSLYGIMQLGDATSLLLISIGLVSSVMAILSLNLKNSLNRRINIIVAIVMIIVGIIFDIIGLGTFSITHYLNHGFMYVLGILIIWFAWKW